MQLKKILTLATTLFGAVISKDYIVNFRNDTVLTSIQNDVPFTGRVGDSFTLLLDENRSIPYLYNFNIPEASVGLLNITSDTWKPLVTSS